MTRVLIAINDPQLADKVAGMVAESDDLELASTVRDPQELRGALPRADVDAVVIHDRRGTVSLIEITRELTTAHPDLGLVLIVTEDSPELLRGGMQAGARDVIAEPLGLEKLETSVMAAAAWTQALRRRAMRDGGGDIVGMGRVVTIVGAKGGVGTTTIAIHLALAARELDAASVCLVEYDLAAGDMRAFLDLPYGRGVVDLAGVSEEVTSRHLRETMYTHASGMRVLLAPQEGEQAEEVSGSAARNILTAIRTRADLTIVDAGAMMNDVTSVAAEMADTVLVVTTPDVVSLRGVVRMLSLWDRLKIEPAEVAVLLNRTSRKLEVQPDLVRRVVPAPLLETAIPADFFALESPVNTGIPATAAASDAMLRPLAAVLGEISALPARAEEAGRDRARSIVTRLAGERGQAVIEFTGLLPLLALVLILVWQIVLVGMTYSFGGHAARAGARAFAVGDPVKPAALNSVPGAWKTADVSDSTDGQGYGTVHVQMKMPLLIPGLQIPVTIKSSAGTVIEDQLLPGQQSLLSTTLDGGGGAAGTVKPLQPALPTTGPKATLLPNGDATVPKDAPPIVATLIEAANSIDQTPYPDPDAHFGSLAKPWPAYDCSGSTSYVLFRGNIIPDGNYVSSDFLNYSGWDSGPGKWVTVYAKPGSGEDGHVHIVIAGLDFDTDGPQDGPRWYEPSELTDFGPPYVESHPPNL
jgi:pilus assembly protein CpaE